MAKTIMVVDDSASLRQVLSIALKGVGYDVIEACDGADALDRLNGAKVHLVISDVNMPNMDGITFVQKLKKIPAYKFTPVIMLTTESQDEMREKGRAAGAKAWVIKPFRPVEMLDAVSKLIAP